LAQKCWKNENYVFHFLYLESYVVPKKIYRFGVAIKTVKKGKREKIWKKKFTSYLSLFPFISKHLQFRENNTGIGGNFCFLSKKTQ